MAKRGCEKGESRRKGKPNKSTQEIKDIIDANVDFNVVIQKMVELIKGVEVQGTNKNGTTYLMDLQPNTFAAKLLLEYRFGKPKETVNLGKDTIDAIEVIIRHSKV